jgi:hypothetical protein
MQAEAIFIPSDFAESNAIQNVNLRVIAEALIQTTSARESPDRAVLRIRQPNIEN